MNAKHRQVGAQRGRFTVDMSPFVFGPHVSQRAIELPGLMLIVLRTRIESARIQTVHKRSLNDALFSLGMLGYLKTKTNEQRRTEKTQFFCFVFDLVVLFLPSEMSRSRISQAKMVGFSRLYCSIFDTTVGVATLGLEPPMMPDGRAPMTPP